MLIEKHDRKYNSLVVYGIHDKNDENIFETLRTFFEEDLGIESSRIDKIGIANAHRIPTRQVSNHPKWPDPIIIRFMTNRDKQFIMSKGPTLAEKTFTHGRQPATKYKKM